MSITKLVLRYALPVPDISKYQRFLFIGPHPDDIEIGAGATAARLAALGKDVCFLICTDGRYGDGSAPEGVRSDALAALRQDEARKSASMLGISDVRFIGLSDGSFYETDTLVRELAVQVGMFKPDVIFAPDPCVKSECHADHLRVGAAARQVAYFAPYLNIMANYNAEAAAVKAIALYMTADVNYVYKTSGFLKKQLEALFDCHLSQFPKDSPSSKSLSFYLKLRAFDYGVRALSSTAEGFRVLSETQMHCLPEA